MQTYVLHQVDVTSELSHSGGLHIRPHVLFYQLEWKLVQTNPILHKKLYINYYL